MFDPKVLDGNQYLCDLTWLGRYVARAVAMPCPTPREVVEFRRQRLEEIRTIAAASRGSSNGKGRVGVIPVYGPLDQRQNAALMKAGGTSTEEIGLYLDYLVNDSSVTAILLDIDSPGGTSYGIEELSDQIAVAGSQKKVYGVANSMTASAAFWIGSAVQKLYVTPGGDVGSVGVYCVHVDQSEALAKEGVKVNIVKAGRYKAEINNVEPLSAEARDHLQEVVDATYAKFIKTLARNRGVSQQHVRDHFGQGRMLQAEAALAAKMVDGIATFAEVLDKLGGGRPLMPAANGPSMAVLRARHEHMKAKASREFPGIQHERSIP